MHKFGPQIIGAWLVWSDTLETKVRIRDWHSVHRKYAKDNASYQLASWEGHVMDALHAASSTTGASWPPSLNARPAIRRTDGEKRDLSFLTKLDEACGPIEGDGTRSRDVPYYKPPQGGQRYGHGPCNQHCSKYHDIDIVNCHPTVLLHYAKSHDLETPHLLEYVLNRDAMLRKVACFYGLVGTSLCKFAVLILLNGGSVETWAVETKCPDNSDLVALELQEMESEFTYIRNHMLNTTFKDETAQWMKILGEQAQLRVTNAAEAYKKVSMDSSATQENKAEAKCALDTATWKSAPVSLTRSCFSMRTHDLKDELLTVVDETLCDKGWVIASLIFDGVMTEHRIDANITHAMRDAEAAVKHRLKYKNFQLVEKEFFNPAGYGGAISDGMEEDTGNGWDAGASHGAAEEGSCSVEEAVQTMAMKIDDDYDEY